SRSPLRVRMEVASACNAGFSWNCARRLGKRTCLTYLCSRSNCPPAIFGQYSRRSATATRELSSHQYAVKCGQYLAERILATDAGQYLSRSPSVGLNNSQLHVQVSRECSV